MKRLIPALLAAALAAAPALAQTGTPAAPPASGSTTPPAAGSAVEQPAAIVTETGVREKLEAAGYADITSISHDGSGGWTAKARKDNRVVTVGLSQTGQVSER